MKYLLKAHYSGNKYANKLMTEGFDFEKIEVQARHYYDLAIQDIQMDVLHDLANIKNLASTKFPF